MKKHLSRDFVTVSFMCTCMIVCSHEGDCGWECDEFGVSLGKVKMV